MTEAVHTHMDEECMHLTLGYIFKKWEKQEQNHGPWVYIGSICIGGGVQKHLVVLGMHTNLYLKPDELGLVYRTLYYLRF